MPAPKQLVVRIPADLAAELKGDAAASGRTRSEIVREALRRYLGGSNGGRPTPAARVKRLIGSIESGVPDLAEAHRRYVLESLRRGN